MQRDAKSGDVLSLLVSAKVLEAESSKHRFTMEPNTKAERHKTLQRRNRRQRSLIVKAVQLATLCDAEIIVGIQIREIGL